MNRQCLDCGAVVNVVKGSRCEACEARFQLRLTRSKNAEFGGSGGRWQTIRREVYARQEGRCAGCGVDLDGKYEVDHVRPRSEFRVPSSESRVQASATENLQAVCRECHLAKTRRDRERVKA